MKRSLMIMALMGSTMLTPTKADAMPPVVGFVVGALGVSATAAAAIGISAGYAAGAYFGATVLGSFVVKTVIAVGLSAIAAKLSEKSISQPPPSARMTNYAQPISYAEDVYGRTRKGGPIGFTEFASNRRYYAPIIAAHPIEGIVEHWIGEKVVELSAEADTDVGNITTDPFVTVGRIDVMDGGAGQAANAGLIAKFPEVTSDFDFKGLSGAVIWCRRVANEDFSKIYPTGREWPYAPVLDGHNDIYDPRDLSTGYSNNAALIIAHWIVNKLGKTVDWDAVEVEADYCDTVVVNAETENQPIWTINGSTSDDQEYEDQRAQMAISCDAFIFDNPDGTVGFYVGRWIEPTITLTNADFLSKEITTGGWGGNIVDEVASVYTEPGNAWRETPSGSWVHTAKTIPARDDPRLYMVTNHNQASRINRRLATMKNAEWTLTGTLKMTGYELMGHRFFRFIDDELGIDEYFEVGELSRESLSTFSISANSVSPDDFAEALTEPARPTYGSATSDDTVAVVANVTANQSAPATIDVDWDLPDDSYTQQVRYKNTLDSTWQTITVPDTQDHLRITGLAVDGTYEFQARNRTAALRPSDWSTSVEEDVVNNSTAPAAITAFTGAEVAGVATLTITAPNDSNFAGVDIYHSTSAVFGTATELDTAFGAANSTYEYEDLTAGTGTHYYWGIPVNPSGIEGPTSGPETIVIP